MQIRFTELTDSQWEIIKKYVSHHNPKKHDLREIINAILWICRTGSQWRNLDSKYPKWESVYYYFHIWNKDGLWDRSLSELVCCERQRQGRETEPSAVAVDSQSVKSVALVAEESRGVDGAKLIKGRKRHIVVDTLGLLIAVFVSRADLHDGEGGIELLWQIDKKTQRLELVRADGAYGGAFKEVAEGIYGWTVETTQRPPSQKGFVPQVGRWQVERSFGWLNFYRRLAKDYEKTPQSAQAFIQLAFISIILARLA